MIAIERMLLPHEALVYLLNLAVIVSLACVAGLAVACACRKCFAPMQHGILVSALALALASPLLMWLAERSGIGLVRITLSQPVHPQPDAQLDPAFPDTTPIGGQAIGFPQASGRGLGGTHQPEATRALEGNTSSGSTSVPWWHWAGSLAAYGWAAGICFGLMRLAKGLSVVARLRRSFETPADGRLQEPVCDAARTLRLSGPPTIRLSSLTPLPMALGFFRPVIVLPATATEELSREQLKAVLLHEVAHLARRDHWVGLAQHAAGILFWWNPLVTRISDRIGELREDICDNYVLRAQGDGAGFAKVLVEAAARVTPESRLPSAIGVLKPNLSALGGRVSRLIDRNRNTSTTLSPASVVMLVIFGLAGLTVMLFAGGLHVAQARPLAESEIEAEEAVEAVAGGGSSAEPIEEDPVDKDALLRSLRASAKERANAMLTGSVQVRWTRNTWPSPNPSFRKRRATSKCTGTLYFDREQLRFDSTTRSTRENGETREYVAQHLDTGDWTARVSGTTVTVNAAPRRRLPEDYDPRHMGKVFVGDSARLRVEWTVYEGVKCLRLEEASPRVGLRSVFIVDPQRGYIVLREEHHYDNSVRENNEVKEALATVAATQYRYDKAVGIWLPTRRDMQLYDAVPLGVDRQPTRIRHTVIELTEYSLKRPPTGTFTIGGLGLSQLSRLVDKRERDGKWREYPLPARNLADPDSVLDTKGLPPDLVDSILGIE